MRSMGAWVAVAAAALVLMPMSTGAEEAQEETQAKERVYGWELMSPEEFAEQRAKMRGAKTAQERERVRAEHHANMAVRAQERGVDLIGPRPAGAGRGKQQGIGAGPGAGGGRGGGGPKR